MVILVARSPVVPVVAGPLILVQFLSLRPLLLQSLLCLRPAAVSSAWLLLGRAGQAFRLVALFEQSGLLAAFLEWLLREDLGEVVSCLCR